MTWVMSSGIYQTRHAHHVAVVIRYGQGVEEGSGHDGTVAKPPSNLVDAIIQTLLLQPGIPVSKHVHLHGLVAVDQVYGPDGDGANIAVPSVAVAKEQPPGLGDLQRALRGIRKPHLVDVHIGTLRSKLGECAGLIETVRGVGYKLGGKR